MKFVRMKRYNEVIIFPPIIEHSKFKDLEIISAGFCIIGVNRIDCFGESVSLKITSNPIEDSYFATRQVFGLAKGQMQGKRSMNMHMDGDSW